MVSCPRMLSCGNDALRTLSRVRLPTVYESNTWQNRVENTYPGVRCDIPAHAYQSVFSPNTQWTEEFAQGAEIRDYWQSVARKYNVYQYLRLQQQVQKAEWLAGEGKWKVTIKHVDGSDKVRLSLVLRDPVSLRKLGTD